jgi:hypothetical protein
MSFLWPNRVSAWQLTLVKIGFGLVATACGVLLLMCEVERVRDAADRVH